MAAVRGELVLLGWSAHRQAMAALAEPLAASLTLASALRAAAAVLVTVVLHQRD